MMNDNKYSQLKPRSVTHVLAELSKEWLASNTNNNKRVKVMVESSILIRKKLFKDWMKLIA